MKTTSDLRARARNWLQGHGLYEPKPTSDWQPLDAEAMSRFEARFAHLPKCELTAGQQAALDIAERRRTDGTGRYLTHEEVMRVRSLQELLAAVRAEAIEECVEKAMTFYEEDGTEAGVLARIRSLLVPKSSGEGEARDSEK